MLVLQHQGFSCIRLCNRLLSRFFSRPLLFAAFAAITLAVQTADAQSTKFVSSLITTAPVRNNYTGYVGMQFTVGASPIFVTQLGRYSIGLGITQTRTIKLVNAQTGVDVPNGAVVMLAYSSDVINGFAYANLPSALQLPANTSYFLLSQETAGGDLWYDYTPVSTTSVASVNAAVYQDAAGRYIPVPQSAGYSYVPVNFGYATPASTPGPGGALISGFNGTTIRNNYNGFVGLELSVGASAVTVTSLGRIALPGNNGTHALKLVNAQTSQDVTGGAVSIRMTPGNGSTFEYAALPAPLTLTANTSYLLLSSETSGGDTWYDYSAVTGVTSGIGIAGAVYSDSGGRYVVVPNTANYSYVPVNLITSSSNTVPPGTITITSPADNSVFGTGNITFSANYQPAGASPAASVQFSINGRVFGPPLAGPPYSFQIDGGALSGTSNTLTAAGTDAAGNTITSQSISFLVANNTLSFIQSNPGSAVQVGPVLNQQYGIQFTVGPTPITVQQLGFFANNLTTYMHVTTYAILRLVDAGTGLDVPGGSVIDRVFYGTDGYAYAPLPEPVTLQPNKSYYLLAGSQYTSSVDFLFDSPAPDPPSVFLSGPATNSTLTGLSPLSIIAYSGPLSITAVQLQVDGKSALAPILSPSAYAAVNVSLDTSTISNGAHVLTATATDSLGNVGTSTAINVSVNNAASGNANSPDFIKSFSPTFLRNNYSGFLGMSFTVGSVPLQVSALGRICVAGNSNSHSVKIVRASNGADLSGGSVAVSLSGCTPSQFVYSNLTSPVTLAASSSYYLVDQETIGADQWYEYSPVSAASDAMVNGPVYAGGGQWVTVNSPGSSYVPLNFRFTSAPATANPTFTVTLSDNPVTANAVSALPVASVQFFVDGYAFGVPVSPAPYPLPAVPALGAGYHSVVAVAKDTAGNTATSPALYKQFSTGLTDVISFTGTNVRNNYSGWVGFRLTTGNAANLTLGPATFGLGRLCLAGNSKVHLVKLVNAATGIDVPNAVAWINMSGCAVGSIPDASFSGISLAPNTSYYVVSQEANGGDTWYDVSPATPLAAVYAVLTPIQFEIGLRPTLTGANFTIDGPVYSAADGSLVLVPFPNYSYVGLAVGGLSFAYCPGVDDCPPE